MDAIRHLYQNQIYPPMSHPLSDPAVTAVSARMAGLECPHPRTARILEIGCCSGHNLIPLAIRWPESRFTGIDLAGRSISEARERVAAIGLTNIDFQTADLLAYEPVEGPYDYIIAHGFWSWVPDAVQSALLEFCRKNLSGSGIATVSFNVEAGWRTRFPVIEKARAIREAGGVDVMTALSILKTVTDPADPESGIIDDMLGRGPAILHFDDFGPVNDPWPLDRFVKSAGSKGLRWLGSTEPSEAWNGSMEDLVRADEITGRTFRSEILCRDDAPATAGFTDEIFSAVLALCAVRKGPEPLSPEWKRFQPAVDALAHACTPISVFHATMPQEDAGAFVNLTVQAIRHRAVLPRIEPTGFASSPPDFPTLDPFRLLCARQRLPLVDAWHKSCGFPQEHYQVLEAMDGTRDIAELEALSKARCPDLDFTPWMHHLAWRGMFA